MSRIGFTRLLLANATHRKFHISTTAHRLSLDANETLSASTQKRVKQSTLAIQNQTANAGPNTIGFDPFDLIGRCSL
jgi:hypothetical protein